MPIFPLSSPIKLKPGFQIRYGGTLTAGWFPTREAAQAQVDRMSLVPDHPTLRIVTTEEVFDSWTRIEDFYKAHGSPGAPNAADPVITRTAVRDSMKDTKGDEYYVEVPSASHLALRYAADPKAFKLNRYAQFLSMEKPQGGWVDPVNGEIHPHSSRYIFTFDWVHGGDGNADTGGSVARAMAARTILGITLLTTEANWTNSPYQVVGNGCEQIAVAVGAMKQKLDELDLPYDGIRLVCNPDRAGVIKLTDVELVGENLRYDLPEDPRHGRYVWPENLAVVLYAKPTDPKPGLCFSTLQFRMLEQMVVECKAADRRGRIVEDYCAVLACPELLFPVIW